MVIPLHERPRSGPYSGINARSAKRFLIEQFKAEGFVAPEDDAKEIVMHVTGYDATDFVLRGTEFLTPEQFDQVKTLADRRMTGEPVDMILGWREFYGRRFKVSKDVLSPRGDTETLVNCGLKALKNINDPRIVDLGTGSGALIITLLSERTTAQGLGIDISDQALRLATENAQALDVLDRLKFQNSNWFENIDGMFDLIISNPPYITDEAMKNLPADVLEYDPDLALRGGVNGLDPYQVICARAPHFLKPNGALWVEIGYDQGEAVRSLFLRSGFTSVCVIKDLSGHDRCVGGIHKAVSNVRV